MKKHTVVEQVQYVRDVLITRDINGIPIAWLGGKGTSEHLDAILGDVVDRLDRVHKLLERTPEARQDHYPTEKI